MKKLIPLLLLLPALASAESRSWLKKENPDEVFFGIAAEEDCAVSKDEVDKIIGGVLTRSRIKRDVDGWTPNEVTLYVILNCMDDGGGEVFNIAIQWVKLRYEGETLVMSTNGITYESIGRGDASFVRDSIKETMEDAITDYLKANFDL